MEQHREEVDMIRELDNDFVKDLAEFSKSLAMPPVSASCAF